MSMKNDISKKILKTSLRYLLKPVFQPSVPLRIQRPWIETMGKAGMAVKGVEISQFQIGEIPVDHICRSSEVQVEDPAKTLAVIYLHGGAFITGSPRTHQGLTCHLAKHSGAHIFVPDYRLAPENPFPAALDDATSCYRWLLDNGYNPKNIIIAGDSAGGGLTMATLLKIRDLKLPQPKGAILISPWVDLQLKTRLDTSDKIDPMLSWDCLQQSATHYRGLESLDHPLISPLNADLSQLAPCLTIVGEEEILLSDSQRLQKNLLAAGNQSELLIAPRMWHVYPLHAGILEESDQAIEKMAGFIIA